MNPNAPIKPQDVVNQPELDPKGASLGLAQAEQSAQNAHAARAEPELSTPEVIDDNSAELDERAYYDDDEVDDDNYDDDDDSDLIAIVRYRLEHPAPTTRVTLDELLTL